MALEEENVAAVRDFVERAWNAGDESAFEDHLAEDLGNLGTRESFKALILGMRARFPDLHLDVHDMFGAGEKVVTRFTIRGTGEDGNKVELGGIAIDVMRDGKRVDGWAQLERPSGTAPR
jgi:predicted ester cyclase